MKTKHLVRPARLGDVPVVSRVFKKAVEEHFDYFSPTYTAKVLRQNTAPRLALSVLKPDRLILLATIDGLIRGYAFGALPPSGKAQLYWLYVDPETRGQNIGLSLLSRAIQEFQRKGATELQLVTYRYGKYYSRQGFKHVCQVEEGGVNQAMMRFEFR